LNKDNLKAIQVLHGFESKKWKGKELRVNVVKVRNPQTGGMVDGIQLSAPNTNTDGDVIVGWWLDRGPADKNRAAMGYLFFFSLRIIRLTALTILEI
jgi:hypothetical protein